MAAERSALWARIELCERLASDPKHANDSVLFQGQVVAYRLQDGEVAVHADDDATLLEMLKKLHLSTNDVFIDRFMDWPQDSEFTKQR